MSGGGGSSSSAAVLTQAIDKWRQAALPAVQEELDAAASAIAARQDESETSRKKLIELSRQFKQTAAEDVRRVVAPLMRSFQAEVDSLNQRSRAAEAAFLAVYQKLAVLPDPLPALQHSLDAANRLQRQADLQLEVDNLRKTLHEYNSEFADVKNQEVTVRQLREQIKQYELQIDSQVEERIAAREQMLRESYETREREMQHAGNILSLKLKDIERRADALQKAHDAAQTELHALRSSRDDATDAKAEQMEMLTQDLDRATAKSEALEREVEALKAQIGKMADGNRTSGSSASTAVDNPLVEAELRAKDKHISQLLAEMKELTGKVAGYEQKMAAASEQFESERQQVNQRLDQAQQLLAAQHDYEQVKRELGVLKSIECGESAASTEDAKPLEVLLLEKNHQLQTDNAKLRISEQSAQADDDGGVEEVVEGGRTVDQSVREIVNAFECLVGAELVSGYHRSNHTSEPCRRKRTYRAGEQQLLLQENGASDPQQQHAASSSECTTSRTNDVCHGSATDGNDEGVKSPHHQQLASPPPPATTPTSTSCMSTRSRGGRHQQHSPSPAASSSSLSPRGSTKTHGYNGAATSGAEEAATRELHVRISDHTRQLCKAGTQLDTSVIANECKRLLGCYNIGQRLFARVLLNQSQGSLSELLSKPRPWERLTEKGREAFRRMHGWITDERSIELLRNMAKRPTSSATESFVDDLTPWKQGHAPSREAAGGDNDSSSASAKKDSSSPYNSASEKFNQFCQQLQMNRSPSVTASGSGGAPASSTSPRQQNASQSRWRHDDIPREKIMEIYNRELEKLKEQDSSLEKSIKSAANAKQQQQQRQSQPFDLSSKTATSSAADNGAGGSSKMAMDSSRALTALVASLTAGANKPEPQQPLMSSVVHSAQQPQQQRATRESTRAQLPPLTQAQIDAHANLDTERVVSQVKDFLLMNSISQRQFGEQVLGLSQGSVSDLLARPKTWAQLTQKGREPFIRMALFMKDPAAIDKLKTQRQMQSISVPTTPAGSPLKQTNVSIASNDSGSEHGGSQHSLDLHIGPPITDSDGGELDTAAIASQVKQILITHGIGQKTLGDHVLGVSQGTVSDLLTKPKPWAQLSVKGRVAYTKLLAWLDNPKRLSVFGLSGGSPPNGLGKRSAAAAMAFDLPTMLPFSGVSLLHNPSHMANLIAQHNSSSSLDGAVPPPKKHNRTTVTDVQKRALRFAFAHDQYPSARSMEFLAKELELPSRAVTNWFYNQRCRQKQQLTEQQLAVRKRLPVDLDSLYPNLRSVYNAELTDVIDDDIPVNLTSLKEAIEKKSTNPSSLGRRSVASTGGEDSRCDSAAAVKQELPDAMDEEDDDCKNEVFQFSTSFFKSADSDGRTSAHQQQQAGTSTDRNNNGGDDSKGSTDSNGDDLLSLIATYSNGDETSAQQHNKSTAAAKPVLIGKGGCLLNSMVDKLKLMAEAKTALVRLQQELDAAQGNEQQQQQLIQRLEHDLLAVNSLQPRLPADGAASPEGAEDSSATLIAKAVGAELQNTAEADQGKDKDDHTLLPIVLSQRERFRLRVGQLEEENMQQQQHVALLQGEIDKARQDNVKLYEKIRFLQSYQSGRSGKSAGTAERGTEEMYSTEYENSIDPFKRFNQQEKQRKYQALSAHDKATLGVGRILMASSHARAIVFFYLLFVHLLVFAVLYKLAYTESCKRDAAADCVANFQSHMQQVHGVSDGPQHAHEHLDHPIHQPNGT